MTYEENLKLISMDELKSKAANNAMVDMYRYALCTLEIQRREKLNEVRLIETRVITAQSQAGKTDPRA